MLGMVGFLKQSLKMQGKLPDKWRDDLETVVTIPESTVDTDGVLTSSRPMTVTEDGVLVIG